MSSDSTIERIIQAFILTCPPDTPLTEAAQLMAKARCSSILVMNGSNVLGIWTEQDALKVDFSSAGTLLIPISRLMSFPVKTIHCKTALGEAAIRFREENVRHFLVVDDAGAHKGIITQSDVVMNQGIEYFVALREVKSVLKRNYLALAESVLLSDAVNSMRDGDFDALTVQYEDATHGILTERDVVRFIGANQLHSTVGELANRPLICVPLDSSLYHARKLFTENHIRHLGVVSAEGELLGLITFADILENIEHDYVRNLREALREREQSLEISNRHLRLAEKVFENTFEGIMITSPHNVIESVNPAFTQITGFKANEVIGKSPGILASGKHDRDFYKKMQSDLQAVGHWQGEIWNRRKNGEIYPEWLTINVVKTPLDEVTNYVAIFSDITERKAAEDHVRYLAHHDALTGLPNRTLLVERLSHAISRAHRNQTMAAVMFLDLDRFKLVNDTLGHAVGDQLLKIVAQRLNGCVREDDTVARMGGDEFIIVLEEIPESEKIPSIAMKIIEALSRPMLLDGQEMVVTTSIGISVYPDDDDNADALIKHADVAMYLAKDKGRNNFQFFTAEMNAQAFERMELENRLRKAIESNELVLHYQPQVDIETRRITGMEALVRWQHPKLGLVPPAQFIPIAEETGLIVPIGEWVLRTACAQNKAWQDEGLPPTRVSVNISGRQFKQKDLVECVKNILIETGLDANYLELEITETVAMEHADETVAKLHEIKAMGVRISMDDFGTGHSSLSYLKRFPIDTLKIDKSFVQNLSEGSSDTTIATAISAMAHGLNLKVITEGVETAEQLDFLMGLQRDEVQGYYFSQPLPAEALAALLRSGQPIGERLPAPK